MCNHEAGILTVYRTEIRTYGANGQQVGAEQLQPADRLRYDCSACGAAGEGSARNDPGLPRWVAERLAALPRTAR